MRRWIFILALVCTAGRSRGAELNEVVAGWLARQTNVQSWSADFTQTRVLKTMVQPLISTGQVWFAAPRNFRWELGGDQTIAIRNEEVMLVIYPRLKRAERYQFESTTRSEWKDALALLQSGFPRSRSELDQQFSILRAVPINNLVQLELEPRAPGARKMLPRIHVFLDGELALAGTELVFADGSRMRNDFRNISTNASLAGRFDLTVPAEYKTVEPLRSKSR